MWRWNRFARWLLIFFLPINGPLAFQFKHASLVWEPLSDLGYLTFLLSFSTLLKRLILVKFLLMLRCHSMLAASYSCLLFCGPFLLQKNFRRRNIRKTLLKNLQKDCHK